MACIGRVEHEVNTAFPQMTSRERTLVVEQVNKIKEQLEKRWKTATKSSPIIPEKTDDSGTTNNLDADNEPEVDDESEP